MVYTAWIGDEQSGGVRIFFPLLHILGIRLPFIIKLGVYWNILQTIRYFSETQLLSDLRKLVFIWGLARSSTALLIPLI